MSEKLSLEAHDEGMREFRRAVLRVAAIGVIAIAIAESIALFVAGAELFRCLLPSVLLLPAALCLALLQSGRDMAAGFVIVIGVTAAYAALVIRNPDAFAHSWGVLPVFCLFTGFLIDKWLMVGVYLCAVGLVLGLNLGSGISGEDGPLYAIVLEGGIISVGVVIVLYFSRHARMSQQALRERILKIQRSIPPISRSGSRVARAASGLHTTANQQREGSMRQFSAVQETRQALHSTLESSREIARSSQIVLAAAEENLQNSGEVSRRMEAFAAETERMIEILDAIKSIANKSEILALNASIEGSKAGDAGKGFALVAAQMQALAEQVMSSVKNMRNMTGNLRQVSAQTRSSVENAIRLAESTAVAAREISQATLLQESSTEQVTLAMDDIATISNQVAESSDSTLESSSELSNVAEELPRLLEDLSSSSS